MNLIKHYVLKTYERVDIKDHVLLIVILTEGELSASRSVLFSPNINPGTRWTAGGLDKLEKNYCA
jgi:hypothetical protein